MEKPTLVFGFIVTGACLAVWFGLCPVSTCVLVLVAAVLVAPVALYRIWPREEPEPDDEQ